MTDFTQPSSSSLPLPDFAVGESAAREPAAAPSGGLTGTRLVLCPGHRRKLESLAEMSYPFEACGVLAGRLKDGGRSAGSGGETTVRVRKVWSARNVGGRVRDRYRLDPEDFLAADRRARERDLEIVGIWHSHPNRPPVPSRLDLEAAWDGYSYLILGVDPRGRVDFRSWRRETRRAALGQLRQVMLEEAVHFENDDPLAASLEAASLSAGGAGDLTGGDA